MAKKSDAQKLTNIYTKICNPLRDLNSCEIERMLSNSRLGDDIRLQVAFAEMERATPIFSICIQKRISGVLGRKWKINPVDDTPEAKKQAEEVQKMFDKCDAMNKDGLTEALSHLCLSTFRGRAAVKPFVDDGKLILKKLDNWNFLSYQGRNYWNPDANHTFISFQKMDEKALEAEGLKILPDDEVAYIVDDKPLDWAGLSIFLRLLIGETQWARATEKFGLPQILLTAPEGTPEQDLDKFNYRAQAIYEGASGTVPFGTKVDILTQARGQDPFTQFIQHQYEQFVILATGSTIATLGGTSGSSGTGMGSDTANIQNSQFEQLVSLDCKRISNAFETVVRKCVKSIFGNNAEIKCKFEFVTDEKIDVNEYLNYAKQIQELGGTIDLKKLRDIIKIDIMADDIKDVWKPGVNGGE